MALRLSTGLRNKLGAYKALAANLMTGTTISFGDGTGSGGRDQILDSGSGLANFHIKKMITVAGSGSNNGSFEILSVAAGAIEVPAGSLTTESAGAQVVLAMAAGASWSDIFRNGIIRIYSGSQPTDGDSAETGSLLAKITLSAGSFTPGSPTNGINLDLSASGVLAKDLDESWQGTGLADGTAGWFRFYDNSETTGASSTGVRFDGIVSTSGAQLNMANTSIVTSGNVNVDAFNTTVPAS